MIRSHSHSLRILPLKYFHLLYKPKLSFKSLVFVLVVETLQLVQVHLIDMVGDPELVLRLHLLKVLQLLEYVMLLVEIGRTWRHLAHNLLGLEVERLLRRLKHQVLVCWRIVCPHCRLY